ncbi:MAG TPA: hypothetical protein VF981_12495 [Gemmatimonadaceae bacterium]
MDKQTLAVMIPVITMFFTGLIAFSFTRLGKAVAKRIEGGHSDDVLERVARLEEENESLHRSLLEAHERLETAERMLRQDASRASLRP